MKQLTNLIEQLSKNKLLFGIILVIFSQIVFALMDNAIKVLVKDISVITVLLFRNLIMLIFVTPSFIKTGQLVPSFKRVHFHFLRSFSGIIAMIFIFLSLHYLSLSEATVLRSIGPLFIPILAFLWLKEKLSFILIPCFTISFIGIILLSGMDKPELSWYSLLPIMSGLFTAFAMVSIKRISNIASGIEIVFYFSLVGTLISLGLFFYFNTPLPTKLIFWGFILLMGILGTLGQVSLTQANHYASASLLAPFYYLNPLFGALLSHFFWNETLGFWGWIGTILIIFSGILLTIKSIRKKSSE